MTGTQLVRVGLEHLLVFIRSWNRYRIPKIQSQRTLASFWVAALARDSVSVEQQEDHAELAEFLRQLDGQQGNANAAYYARLLQSCGKLRELSAGKRLHAHIEGGALGGILLLRNNLINMYAKCGDLEAARSVFDDMGERNVLSWNFIISACIQHGHKQEALELFRRMLLLCDASQMPNKVSCVIVLGACESPAFLAEGKLIHSHAVKIGAESDVIVGTALLNMYSRCGSLDDARSLFDRMLERNVVSWTGLIAAYAQHGHVQDAIRLFQKMLLEGVRPDKVTFLTVLGACSDPKTLSHGKVIHALISESEFRAEVMVGNALVSMYGKCGSLDDASRVFEAWKQRNVVSWNGMMAVYMQHDEHEGVLRVFQQMQLEGMRPEKVTFGTVLTTCANGGLSQQGKLVHDQIAERGFESDDVLANALINMYGKCGNLKDARRMFEGMPDWDVVSWTAMISAYAHHEKGGEALQLLKQMQLEGFKPNGYTLVSALNACVVLEALEAGRQIHSHIMDCRLESEALVSNALISMYCKCGRMEDAELIFKQKKSQRNVISWTAMISAYAQHDHHEKALFLFRQMGLEGLNPDYLTLVTVLNSCASLGALAEGKLIHARIASYHQVDDFVGNALVNLYSKCGSLEEAVDVFNNLNRQNVVSWNEMVAAYGQCGRGKRAVRFFQQMQLEGVEPNSITYINVLSACAGLAALKEGKLVHAQVVGRGFESQIVVRNALVNFYGKCGRLADAQAMFDELQEQDSVSWNVLIAAYAHQGHGEKVLKLFRRMQQDGVKGNKITFVSVLSACSHAGFIDEGYHLFVSLEREHCITPALDHYACIIDLLGRAGWLDIAEGIIERMPFPPDGVIWMTLLGSCCNHGDMKRGKHAAQRALELDNRHAAAYVVLSNIYAAAGEWNEVANIRRLMDEHGVKKEPGCSSIEVKNRVHEFIAGDLSHPQISEIYAELERLNRLMKEAGFVADTKLVLHDVQEAAKEQLLHFHSEKLALGFGLISTAPGTPLHIIKNLRVCGDCHTAIKVISEIVGREIVVRDCIRFHEFKHGICSCGDYW